MAIIGEDDVAEAASLVGAFSMSARERLIPMESLDWGYRVMFEVYCT